MKINHPVKYCNKLASDLEFLTNKLMKLEYLLPNEARHNLNYHLAEIANYTKDLCDIIVDTYNKGSKDESI